MTVVGAQKVTFTVTVPPGGTLAPKGARLPMRVPVPTACARIRRTPFRGSITWSPSRINLLPPAILMTLPIWPTRRYGSFPAPTMSSFTNRSWMPCTSITSTMSRLATSQAGVQNTVAMGGLCHGQDNTCRTRKHHGFRLPLVMAPSNPAFRAGLTGARIGGVDLNGLKEVRFHVQ